jgi:hypothetical protein
MPDISTEETNHWGSTDQARGLRRRRDLARVDGRPVCSHPETGIIMHKYHVVIANSDEPIEVEADQVETVSGFVKFIKRVDGPQGREFVLVRQIKAASIREVINIYEAS